MNKPMNLNYSVWVTLYGTSAKSAGIVGNRQHTRSSWKTGKLLGPFTIGGAK